MRNFYHYAVRIAILVTCIFAVAQAGLTNEESEKISPKYTNVDIEIMYEWSGTEYFKGVDVFDNTQNENPYLIISHTELGRSEIFILEGIRVTVIDHDTGNVLQIYTSRKR